MIDQDLMNYLRGFVTEQRQARFEKVLANRTYFLTVVAEDVFQMHNTSAVLRSCDAFGIQRFYAIEDRFESRLDKNIAMGAEKWVDVERFQSVQECLKVVKEAGYLLVATSPEVPPEYAGKKPLYHLDDFPLKQPTALLFGTEREGLSPEMLKMADQYLQIPMQGFTESFNISVAAALILHRLSGEMRKSELPWPLTEEQKNQVRWAWTKKSIKDVEAIIGRYYKK
jgi:tRNA (guanosine-2'-O-)-methyltransferase